MRDVEAHFGVRDLTAELEAAKVELAELKAQQRRALTCSEGARRQKEMLEQAVRDMAFRSFPSDFDGATYLPPAGCAIRDGRGDWRMALSIDRIHGARGCHAP